MVSAPPTLSAMSPALPVPLALVLIRPPCDRVNVPALSVIVPASPPLAAVAGLAAPLALELDRICAPVATVTSPVMATPIDPAVPLPGVLASIKALFWTVKRPPARLIVPPVPAGTGAPFASTNPVP